jgi:hypothetical protein
VTHAVVRSALCMCIWWTLPPPQSRPVFSASLLSHGADSLFALCAGGSNGCVRRVRLVTWRERVSE